MILQQAISMATGGLPIPASTFTVHHRLGCHLADFIHHATHSPPTVETAGLQKHSTINLRNKHMFAAGF
jgi:hypothetical protein